MKDYLIILFNDAAEKLDYLKDADLKFEVPNISSHGDYSTNVAMTLTKKLKRNPRDIAAEIIDSLEADESIISKIEIAGPGFINFSFTPGFVAKVVIDVIKRGTDYGRTDQYKGKKANVEFVSANPTGPLTVGHGRGAVIGDTIAKMLEWIGYDVEREYYFNNAGRQMRMLGNSVRLRYFELLGEKIDFPEDHYQGEYIKDIAQRVYDEYSGKLKDEEPEGKFKEYAERIIFEDIKTSLEKIKIVHDIYFNEKSLYDEGKIDKVLKSFKERDLSFEKEGAVWLKFDEMGRDEPKVIVKSMGEPTYRLPDIAYHLTKFERNYDLIVDIFGSDHGATYPDVLAGVKALGYDSDKIRVLIHQFVTILDKGEVVKMSTRKANFITLDELVDEVGSDVVRYFFIMRNISSHLNFDIDLAKKQSDENPVFYLQYAHARISSILKMTQEQELNQSLDNLDLLTSEAEQNLLKKIHLFSETILFSAENYEPNRIANYLEELAAAFHKFYTDCRIIGSEKSLAEARISLAVTAQIVLKNGLSILGLEAPERM
ncbi:arginine--tRNA ligase [Bacteroidota bacterium]